MGCRVPAAMCRVADAGVQSGGVQGPGRRDLVQGAACNVLGVKPWALRARGTGRAADDEGTTDLSLEDGAAAASPPCPEEDRRSHLQQGHLLVWVQGWGKVLQAEHRGFALGLNWCYFKLTVSRCEIRHSCSKGQVLPWLWVQGWCCSRRYPGADGCSGGCSVTDLSGLHTYCA